MAERSAKSGTRGRPNFEIPITGIQEKSYPFEFLAPSAELELDGCIGLVTLIGKMSYLGSQYRVEAEVNFQTEVECDRCLSPVRSEHCTELLVVFEMSASALAADSEIAPLQADASSILLDNDVRQAVFLAMPLKNLCRDDCAGLCIRCGANKNKSDCECETGNIDPRWNALGALLSGKQEKDL